MLVVDDSPSVIALLRPVLESEGFEVHAAATGAAALEDTVRLSPAAVVLDIGLPDRHGLDVCRDIRRVSDAFVLMLTGRGEEADRLIGLGAGADDYLTKPCSPREIAMRIQAMLRRRMPGAPVQRTVEQEPRESAATVVVGPLELDEPARIARVDGTEVDLTRIEFDLLCELVRARGMVVTNSQLVDAIWGMTWDGDGRTIATHVSNLRRKLGDRDRTAPLVRTVRGVGYRIQSLASS